MLRWRDGHFLWADERLDLMLREVFPVQLPEQDAHLPGESDAPRHPGVEGQAVPRRIEVEAALRYALLNLVLQEDHRLPTGTVTFLFTDIEGSTRLWERDRREMAQAVERHVKLLRGAIEDHSGVLYQVVGDVIQAAFPTAPQAAAALDAQRAILREDWSEVGGLRVRIGVHTGAARPVAEGDYLAPALNRLARLLSAGHSGQVLLSQVAQQRARGQLPAMPFHVASCQAMRTYVASGHRRATAMRPGDGV